MQRGIVHRQLPRNKQQPLRGHRGRNAAKRLRCQILPQLHLRNDHFARRKYDAVHRRPAGRNAGRLLRRLAERLENDHLQLQPHERLDARIHVQRPDYPGALHQSDEAERHLRRPDRALHRQNRESLRHEPRNGRFRFPTRKSESAERFRFPTIRRPTFTGRCSTNWTKRSRC